MYTYRVIYRGYARYIVGTMSCMCRLRVKLILLIIDRGESKYLPRDIVYTLGLQQKQNRQSVQ